MKRAISKVQVLFVAMAMAVSGVAAAETPDEALHKLMAGNQSFVAGNFANLEANSTPAVRQSLATGQHPYAIVLDCSDSRVAPEIIFDKGLGEIFVIRVAGNVVAPHQLGSIEYAIEHLGASLLVVLGHSKCGAVNATVGALKPGTCDVDAPEGNIGSLIESIAPAVERSCKTSPTDLLATSIDENVNLVAKRISKKSRIVEEAIFLGKLKMVKARYDLDDGVVKLLAE